MPAVCFPIPCKSLMAVSEEMAEGNGRGSLMTAVGKHAMLTSMPVSMCESNICQLTGGKGSRVRGQLYRVRLIDSPKDD